MINDCYAKLAIIVFLILTCIFVLYFSVAKGPVIVRILLHH